MDSRSNNPGVGANAPQRESIIERIPRLDAQGEPINPIRFSDLPYDVILTIFDYLEPQEIARFRRVAQYCNWVARPVVFRRIILSLRTTSFLRPRSALWPQVRQATLNVYDALVSVQGQIHVDVNYLRRCISLLALCPNVDLLIVEGCRITAACEAFRYFLLLTQDYDTIPIRRMHVNIGEAFIAGAGSTLTGSRDYNPGDTDINNWNINKTVGQALRAAPMPNLKELFFNFGPNSSKIVRMDNMVETIFKAHINTVTTLKIISLEVTNLDCDVPPELIHHPLSVPNEELEFMRDEDKLTKSRLHFLTFRSNILRVFKYYNENLIDGDYDIALDDCCQVFPNAVELDVITRRAREFDYGRFWQVPVMPSLEILRTNYPVLTHDYQANQAFDTTEITRNLVNRGMTGLKQVVWYTRTILDPGIELTPFVSIFWDADQKEIYRDREGRLIVWTKDRPPFSGYWWGQKEIEYLREFARE